MKRALSLTFAIFLTLLALGTDDPARAGADEGWAAYQRGDYPAALREWEPLAVRGDRTAQFNLGLMYEKGRGVTRDMTRAILWYRRSASQGYADALNNLGRIYFTGDGVKEDYKEAVTLFHAAAEQGVAWSHFFLGMIFAGGGEGIEPNPVEAYKWLTLASSLHTERKPREDALNARKDVAAKLSPVQIAVAEKLAHDWMTRFKSEKPLR